MGWQPFIYPGLWKFQSVFCNIFRSVSLDVLVLVFYSVFYICAIVCRIFIAHAEYHRTYCMWDWAEVTFPNYPSSTVCLGLLRKLWCWFFLPALRHTSIDYFVWEHVVCWGVGTLCGNWPTSCRSRLLTVNDSLPFGCVYLLSLSSPRPVHSLVLQSPPGNTV